MKLPTATEIGFGLLPLTVNSVHVLKEPSPLPKNTEISLELKLAVTMYKLLSVLNNPTVIDFSSGLLPPTENSVDEPNMPSLFSRNTEDSVPEVIRKNSKTK